MFDIGLFLAKISILIPVLTAFIACATWVYGAYLVIDRIDLSVAESISWVTLRLSDAITTVNTYHDSRFLYTILQCVGLEDGVDALIYLTTYLSLLSESILVVISLLTTGLIATWVYRKTKLACNVLSASGVNE